MGIWDTVSSVGWIYTPIRLLNGAQKVGRHAVSIDERRAFYRDNLWGKLVDINDKDWPETLRKQGIRQDIAQVWSQVPTPTLEVAIHKIKPPPRGD